MGSFCFSTSTFFLSMDFVFKDLEAKERVMEDMRLALTEQEDTQEQMEQVLEEKLNLIQELSSGKTRVEENINSRLNQRRFCLFCGCKELFEGQISLTPL